MTDLATLGLAVDSSQVKSAAEDLRRFEATAKRTSETVEQVRDRVAKTSAEFGKSATPVKESVRGQAAYGESTKKVIQSLETQRTRLYDLADAQRRLHAANENVARSTGLFAGALRSIVTLLAGGALIAGINAAINRIAAIADLMQDTRLNADILQGLRIGAAQAAVSQDQLTQALKHFTNASKKARADAPELYVLLNRAMAGAGEQFAKLAGAEDGQAKRLVLVAKALGSAKDEATKFQLAQAALGTQNERAINLFQGMADGGREYIEVARQFGILYDAETIRKAEEARRTLETLAVVISDKLRISIVDLLPEITRMLPALERMGATVQDFLASFARPAERPTSTIKREAEDSIATLNDYYRQLQELRSAVPTTLFGVTISNKDEIEALQKKIKGEEEFLELRKQILRTREREAPLLKPPPSSNNAGFLPQAKIKEANDLALAWDRQVTAMMRRDAALRADAETVGQSEAAFAKLRTSLMLEEFLRSKGVKDIEAYRQQIVELGDQAAKTAEKLARARIGVQIDFGKQSWFLDSKSIQIAQQLSGLYGNDVPKALASSEAAAIRVTDAMQDGFQGVSDVVKGVFTAMLTGKSAMDALIAGLDRLADKLANAAFENLLTGALTGNPVQMAIGAAQAGGALVATAFGNNLKLQKAREEWEKAGPAFEKFISTLSGGMQGAISQQFEQLRSQAEQFIDKAFKARDFSAINRILTAFSDAVIRETNAFRESFDGLLSGLEDGLGPSSPFASAASRIKSITDELQGFIDDARISFANDPIALAAGNNPLIAGGGETQVRSATEAAQQYLLSLLGAKPELSATATALQEMSGTAVALQAALVELGMTSDQAAAAISDGVTAAMSDLASKFSADLQREINDALGQGYLNEFADLMKKRQQALDDAARLGTGTALVDRWFQVSAQKIIDDAGLAGTAIADLVALFPVLAGTVTDAASTFDAAFAALGQAVESAQAEVDRRRSILTQAYQRESSEIDGLISRLRSVGEQVRKFRDSLLINNNYTSLNPYEQYLEAQRQFRSVSVLAASGDETALGQLQDVSQAYLDASKSYYASSEQYFRDFDEVSRILQDSEIAANEQIDVATRQLDALNSQVEHLIDIKDGVVSVAQAIAGFQGALGALSVAQGNLNSARDWGIRPEVNKWIQRGLDEAGISYTGNYGPNSGFQEWVNSQTQSIQDQIYAIARTVPQNLIDFYEKQNKVASFQPSYAGGTDFHPGGLAWVGEQGRELVNLPRGAQVIPHNTSMRMASRASNDNGDIRTLVESIVKTMAGVSMTEMNTLKSESAALRAEIRQLTAAVKDNKPKVGKPGSKDLAA